MMEFVNGKDDNPYIMENKSHVPNHQPYIYIDRYTMWGLYHAFVIYAGNYYIKAQFWLKLLLMFFEP